MARNAKFSPTAAIAILLLTGAYLCFSIRQQQLLLLREEQRRLEMEQQMPQIAPIAKKQHQESTTSENLRSSLSSAPPLSEVKTKPSAVLSAVHEAVVQEADAAAEVAANAESSADAQTDSDPDPQT